MQNIIAAIFENESEGFQAITQLHQNPVTDQASIMQMVLVKCKDKDIEIRVFSMSEPENFIKVANGESIGTTCKKGA